MSKVVSTNEVNLLEVRLRLFAALQISYAVGVSLKSFLYFVFTDLHGSPPYYGHMQFNGINTLR